MTPWTITSRLSKALIACIGILWILGVAGAWLLIREEVSELFDSSLKQTAQRIAPLVEIELASKNASGRNGASTFGPLTPKRHEEELHYQVRNTTGRVLLRSHSAPSEPFPIPLKRGYFDTDTRRFYSETFATQDLWIQVAEQPKERMEAIGELFLYLLSPLIAILPVAAFLVWWAVRSALQPLRVVQQELTVRNGQKLDPIGLAGLPGELTPIIEDVNRLLVRLKGALHAERSYAANAAHELRNPIAAARAQAELLAGAAQNDEQKGRANQIVDMLSRLSRQIEKMLQLARAEAGVGLYREATDLAGVIKVIVEDYANRTYVGSRLTFQSHIATGPRVNMDPDAIGIVLHNILDNALAHGSADGNIEIVLEPRAQVRILNDGLVVPVAELDLLTEPFHRARGTAITPGVGLGLSIVSTIMKQAGGAMELKSPATDRSTGFEVKLQFPVSA